MGGGRPGPKQLATEDLPERIVPDPAQQPRFEAQPDQRHAHVGDGSTTGEGNRADLGKDARLEGSGRAHGGNNVEAQVPGHDYHAAPASVKILWLSAASSGVTQKNG